jgi:hypothetical protein
LAHCSPVLPSMSRCRTYRRRSLWSRSRSRSKRRCRSLSCAPSPCQRRSSYSEAARISLGCGRGRRRSRTDQLSAYCSPASGSKCRCRSYRRCSLGAWSRRHSKHQDLPSAIPSYSGR